jgi:hypothetical protein
LKVAGISSSLPFLFTASKQPKLLIHIAMTRKQHSDLEVAQHEDDLATQKYTYYSEGLIPVNPNRYDASDKPELAPLVHEIDKEAKICGIRKRKFWIALIAAIIIVAAAVGGGVGGTLASRSSSSSDAVSVGQPSASANASAGSLSASVQFTSSPTPTSTKPDITQTEVVGPTATILRDCPSSNDTIYESDTVPMKFRKLCDTSFKNINGVDSSVNRVLKSLDLCIEECAAWNVENKVEIIAGKKKVCNAVCWRNTFDKRNDWEGGRCFGYVTGNTTSNGETTFSYGTPPDTRCDAAALINQEW